MIKINWNASIEKTRKKMGVGVIARGNEGKVLATMYSSKLYIIDVIVDEAFSA